MVGKIREQLKPNRNNDDADDCDFDLESLFGHNGLSVRRKVIVKEYLYTVDIDTDVYDASHYSELAYLLRNTSEYDTVVFNLASGGGDIHGGQVLVNAMRKCPSAIKGLVVAPTGSMASSIALSCDILEFESDTNLMFHNYSGGFIGQEHDIRHQKENSDKWVHGLNKRILSPFLTDKEIKRVNDGGTIYVYFDDKNLVDRLTRHINVEKLTKLGYDLSEVTNNSK